MSKLKVRITGNTQVVQFAVGNNKKCPVVNLIKDTCLTKEIGEVKYKNKTESRYQSPMSVRKSIIESTQFALDDSNSTEKLLVCGRIFIIVPNKIFEKDENVKNIENKMTKMREKQYL